MRSDYSAPWSGSFRKGAAWEARKGPSAQVVSWGPGVGAEGSGHWSSPPPTAGSPAPASPRVSPRAPPSARTRGTGSHGSALPAAPPETLCVSQAERHGKAARGQELRPHRWTQRQRVRVVPRGGCAALGLPAPRLRVSSVLCPCWGEKKGKCVWGDLGLRLKGGRRDWASRSFLPWARQLQRQHPRQHPAGPRVAPPAVLARDPGPRAAACPRRPGPRCCTLRRAVKHVTPGRQRGDTGLRCVLDGPLRAGAPAAKSRGIRKLGKRRLSSWLNRNENNVGSHFSV